MSFRSKVTVVTPAASFDLTNLLKVLAALDINDSTPSQKVWLRTAIRQCSLAVARECNRVFPVQSYSESFFAAPCSWADTIQLTHCPIVEITTLTCDGSALVEDTDFSVAADTGLLTRLSSGAQISWSAATPPITVEYDAGFDPIPDDLSDIVHGLINGQWLAVSGERDPFLRSEDIPGVASYTYATLANQSGAGFAASAKDAINHYKSQLFV